MRSAGWGAAIAALLMVTVGIGWLVLRERCKASAQEEQSETQRAADQPGPAGAGSMWWTSVLPTTGKPDQVVYLVNTGMASAMGPISVEVYNEEGTPVSWSRVESLEHVGPEARAYELQPLHDGTVLIRFGDGKHGACPPQARRGVRVRHVSGKGQSTTLEMGASPLGRDGSLDWAQGTVWNESADLLRQHAADRLFEVVTLRVIDGDGTRYKLYVLPGRSLHTFLTEPGGWLAEGETIVSVGVRD